MIPSIEQICEDLAPGRITVQQAQFWLYQHMQNAELRDGFAAAALQGMIPAMQDHVSGDNDPLAFARVASQASYAIADAMLAGKGEGMTREELFAEVRALEDQVMSLISDDSRQAEFEESVSRVEVLTGIARREGWL